MKKTIPEKIIEGAMIIIGLAEAAHLSSLVLKLPFSVCSKVMAVLFLCAVIVLFVWHFAFKGKKSEGKVARGGVGLLRLVQVYPFLFIAIGFFIVLQIVWNYWMHVPYVTGDMTGEIVQTMLTSDSIYTINPLTGEAFGEGIPTRLKILCLPTLYATICKLTGVSSVLLIYSVVPTVVLIISYLVYSRWAVYLFPQEGKKQAIFMLFVVLVYQFGCYTAAMDSFTVFFAGYTGVAIRACVILPYALLCCLQKNWKSVILCLLAEVCVVWTQYGLGYTVIVVVVVLLLKLVYFLLERRKKV